MPSTATTHHFTLLEAIMRISPLFGTVASMSFLLFRLVFPLTCDCNVNSCNTELATSCENPPDCHLTASFFYTHTQCRERFVGQEPPCPDVRLIACRSSGFYRIKLRMSNLPSTPLPGPFEPLSFDLPFPFPWSQFVPCNDQYQ